MLGRRSFDEPPLRGGSTQLSCTMSAAVTPSESDLCKFEQNSLNPHRNDSKVPTRHFRAGGKRSNNITQQSLMGPTEQNIYNSDSKSQEHRYNIQRSKSPRKQ